MPEELLQRMRDIHYPEAPGWFPPAPGWWIVAALLLAALVWLALWLRSRQRKRAPYAVALRLLNDATERQRLGQLDTRAYLDLCNQLLKRLLVHVRHQQSAAPASGERWLLELDSLHGGNQFTKGPGKVLGDLRFAPVAPTADPALHKLLSEFIGRLRQVTDADSPSAPGAEHQPAEATP